MVSLISGGARSRGQQSTITHEQRTYTYVIIFCKLMQQQNSVSWHVDNIWCPLELKPENLSMSYGYELVSQNYRLAERKFRSVFEMVLFLNLENKIFLKAIF